MCGIAGMVARVGEQADATVVHNMCQTIIHRGPDDEGILAQGHVGLGMRRLSIIDLSGGHQPIHNEDSSVWVVFNGEIYNFPELRSELEAHGHTFYTHSDTEVIVHLYEEKGADCVQALRGMFAIALYDRRKDTLLLVRDRLGKKPLYFAEQDGRLYFGSEIKALLAAEPQLADPDPQGLLQFFYFGYIPYPHTSFRRIRKLSPGHLLEFHKGESCIRQYWDLPDYGTYDPGSDDACLEELQQRMEDAVRCRLISDVPLGALLSGGVDSSIVVAAMSRVSPDPVKTFSIGFRNEEFNEAEYARFVAQRFGTDHHELTVDPDIAGTLEHLSGMLEEPFGDSSMIPTYHVSRLARQHVTVALSGDGGDELFAGYDRYMVSLQRQRYNFVPGWAGRLYRRHIYGLLPESVMGRKFAWNITLPPGDRYIDSVSFLPALRRERNLFSEEFLRLAHADHEPQQQFQQWYDQAPAKDLLSRLMYLDTKSYLVEDILTKVDRMSMATSLEMRAPILDHRFVEWVTSLPVHYKYRNGTRKYIFKKLAEKLGIPAELIHRKKQGFALPLVHWMRNELRGLLSVLAEPRAEQRGYFNRRAVRQMFDEHMSGRRDRSSELWLLLVFELWHRNFLEAGRYVPDDATAFGCGDGTRGRAMMEVAESQKPVELTAVEPSALRDTPVFLMTNTLETGGSERQFALLAQALRAHGVLVELGCIERRGPLADRLPAMPEFRVYGRLYSLRSLGTRVALGRYLRRTRIKVAHAFDFYTNILMAPVARMAGVPVVLGSHRQVGDLLSPAKFRAQLAAFRFCDRVLCNSQAAADRLLEAGIPKTKLTIVPNMIPQPFFEPARPLLPAREGKIRIGMVARMNDSSKRHDFLLDVIGELQRRVPNAELVLAGDGPLRTTLEERARSLGISEQVMFVGDQSDIPAVLASLDVSVLTSASESRSNAILESMAAGLPVVATDCAGNREIVGHGQSGFLVPADDRGAWVQELERLATDRELRMQFGAKGRTAVERTCSVSAVRDQYEQIYSGLLREKGKQAAGGGV